MWTVIKTPFLWRSLTKKTLKLTKNAAVSPLPMPSILYVQQYMKWHPPDQVACGKRFLSTKINGAFPVDNMVLQSERKLTLFVKQESHESWSFWIYVTGNCWHALPVLLFFWNLANNFVHFRLSNGFLRWVFQIMPKIWVNSFSSLGEGDDQVNCGMVPLS